MYLKSVSGKGVVGLSFTHKLGPVTMIIGPNASGKTAILRAIRLALLGYEPGIVKKNDRIFQLSGGDSMEVAVMIDDGKIIDRSWRKVRDSIKSGMKGTGQLNIPVVLLDPAEYFSLSADKRTDYVFNRVKIDTEKFSRKALIKRVKTIQVESEGVQCNLSKAVLSGIVDNITFKLQVPDSFTIQEDVQMLLDQSTEEIKAARANLDRMTKTLAGMTELDLKGAGQLSESLPSLNTKITELEKELQELSLQRDRLEQLKGRIKGDPVQESIALRTKINELESKLESQVLLPDPQPQLSEAIAAKSRHLAKVDIASQKLEDIRAAHATDRSKIARKKAWETEILSYEEKTSVIPDLQRQIAELEPVVKGYKPMLPNAEAAVSVCARVVVDVGDQIEAKAKQIEETEAEVTKFLAQASCPTCGARAGGWQDRFKDESAALVEKLKNQVDKLKQAYAKAKQANLDANEGSLVAAKADSGHLTRQTTLHSLQKRLQEAQLAQNKVERLQSAIDALGAIQDYSEAIAECEKNLGTLSEKTGTAEAKVRELEELKAKFLEQGLVAAGIGRELNAKKVELASLGSIIEEMKGLEMDNMESLETAIGAYRCEFSDKTRELERLEAAFNRAKASEQDIVRHKQAEAERNKAEAEFEVLKLVRDEVKAFLGDIIAAAWGPILERANWIAQPILKTPLAVQDNVLGRMEGKKFIGTETFSGTEQAVTYAALCFALSLDSPFKLVMVDEIGRMDEFHKRGFLANIIALQSSGVIDQAIMVDVSPETKNWIGPGMAGVTFIEL